MKTKERRENKTKHASVHNFPESQKHWAVEVNQLQQSNRNTTFPSPCGSNKQQAGGKPV